MKSSSVQNPKTIVALFLFGLIAVFSTSSTRAASITKGTYIHNGKPVALAVYTGPDGDPKSDASTYWALLGKVPEFVFGVEIKADKPDGKIATLKGNIMVSVEIRNQFNMGVAETDKLTLIRDDADSNKWHLSTAEQKRITALVKKNPKKKIPKSKFDEEAGKAWFLQWLPPGTKGKYRKIGE